MTGKRAKTAYGAANVRHKPFSYAKRLGFCYMSLFILILFFKSSETAAEWVADGLRLCAVKLIPALFPFMVASSLMLSGDLGSVASRLLGKPFRLLFGISGNGACAVLLGWACGFPVGAKCAGELYELQRIDADEYKKILCISGTPSPAFLTITVGKGMLGSGTLGIWLYAISLVASSCIGIFIKAISAKNVTCAARTAERAYTPKRIPFSQAFTRAVSESASGMLCVCAFVVFFSAFLGVLEQALSFLDMSDTANALMFSFFELTSGLSRISSLNTSAVLPLCAMAVGWSGLSVHFQAMAIGTHRGISFKPYMLAHIARAGICFVLGLVLSRFIV